MKKSLHSILAAAVFVLTAHSAFAQEKSPATVETPIRIATLDMEKIKRESLAVKDVRGQIANYRKSFQSDIQKEETALRTANKELAKKRTILSPEAFTKERRQFELKVIELQKLVQKRKIELDQAQAQAMLQIERKLNAITANIANQNNISLVLHRKFIFLVARSLDITDLVLKRLNSELTKVPVAKPGKK